MASILRVGVSLIVLLLHLIPAVSVARAQTPAPEAPRWVVLRHVAEDGNVGLLWNAAAGATAYRIWRKEGREADFRILATTEKLQHLDRDVVPGASYRYRLQGVSGPSAGALSEEQSVSIPAVAADRPIPAPSWRRVAVRVIERPGRQPEYSVALGWTPVEGAIGYQLARGREDGTGFAPFGFFTEAHADDTAVEAGGGYAYIVTAFDASFRESPRSLTQTARVSAENALKTDRPADERLDFPAIRAWELQNESPRGAGSQRRAKLTGPFDVALDHARNRLYVSSTGNRHIVVIDLAQGRPLGYIGPRVEMAELGLPLGLAVDGAGNLVVVDQAPAALVVITPEGTLRRRIPIGGKGFKKPPRLIDAAVARDGRIFVTDNANGKVLVLGADGKLLGRWGKAGARPEEFAGIGSIEITADGSVAVADAVAGKIKLFTPQGKFLKAVGERSPGKGGVAFMGGFTALRNGQFLVADLLEQAVKTIGAAVAGATVLPIAAGEAGNEALQLLGPLNLAGDGKELVCVTEGIANRVVCFRLLPQPPGRTQ